MRSDDTFSGGTSEGFPWDFFAAVNDGDESLAKDVLRDAALLPDGQPSPRMQELVDEGAWDTQAVVSLCFMEEGGCGGSVGASGSRFCGKDGCTIATHKKAQRVVETGWYIAAGTKSQGCFWEPYLPTYEDGGPIKPSGGAFLSMEPGLKMSRGQWTLALEAWHLWNAGQLIAHVRELPTSPKATTPSTLGGSGFGKAAPRLEPISTAFDGLDIFEHNVDSLGVVATLSDGVRGDSKGGLFGAAAPVTTHPVVSPVAAQAAMATLGDAQANQSQVLTDLRLQFQELLLELARARESSEMLRHSTAHDRRAAESIIGRLEARVAVLEATPHVSTSPQGMDQLARAVDKCTAAVFGDQGVVSRLSLQFRAFRAKVEAGGGVECHGVKFSSGKEVASWWESKESLNIAVFVDAITLLHGITASYVSRTEAGKRIETQGKNKQDNDLEEIVITSFQTHLPSVFAGGRTTMENSTAPAVLKKTMKSYQDWRPKGEMFPGVATEITDGVKEMTNQIRMYRNEVTSDQAVRDLSSGLLEDSRNFCNELVAFIDRQNDALTHNSSYSPEQIWEMQLECLRKILMELSVCRREVMVAARHQPALYLWGMLKAWQIQKRYLDNHFKDDPALTGIMVRRIVMQSGNDGTKDKLAKVDKIQDQVSEHYRTHTSAIKALQLAVEKLKKP